MHHRNSGLSLFLALVSLALGVPAIAVAENSLPQSVGTVRLQQDASAAEIEMLDIGLAIFDAGIPADKSTHSKLGIFPEIRKSEAQFMAVILRQTLIDSAAWGVVRVLPQADSSAELLISGKIVHSDGLSLVLQISARDATGRQWLERRYSDETTESDYPVAPGTMRSPSRPIVRPA